MLQAAKTRRNLNVTSAVRSQSCLSDVIGNEHVVLLTQLLMSPFLFLVRPKQEGRSGKGLRFCSLMGSKETDSFGDTYEELLKKRDCVSR
jgi:hypothetical protein